MTKTVRCGGWWVVLTVTLISASALGRDFYVNDAQVEGDVALPGCPSMPVGRDVYGCGACDQPCERPGYLLQRIRPLLQGGDTIHLNTGRYRATVAGAPIVSISTSGLALESGSWITLTGPVDADGRARRDAFGVPLAVLDGEGRAPAGVVVEGSGVRVRALRLQDFADAPQPYCGSAVHVLPGEIARSYAFEQLDITGVVSQLGSAIEVEQPANTCSSCSISDNRIHRSSAEGPAIVVGKQSGVRIIGNHITGWGQGAQAWGIGVHGEGTEIRHNVIQGSAGPGIIVAGGAQIIHNTLRNNAQQVPLNLTLPPEVYFEVGSTGVIAHNIIAPSAGAVALDLESLASRLTIDFNGYVLEGGILASIRDDGQRFEALAGWQEASRWDERSVEGDPRFASATDAHLRSVTGRWDGEAWISDRETSDFIDAGDPMGVSGETHFLHGNAPNLGAYGNTAEASLSTASLVKIGGDGQEGTVGSPLASPLRIEVRGFNRFGQLHPSYADVPLRFSVLGGSATISEERIVTDASGRASLQVTPEGPGTLVIEARVEGIPGVMPVTFEATVPGDVPPDPDAENPEPVPGRGKYTVTSGCTQASGPVLPFALMALLGLLRRRRPRS